jgi:hypothetical protein
MEPTDQVAHLMMVREQLPKVVWFSNTDEGKCPKIIHQFNYLPDTCIWQEVY